MASSDAHPARGHASPPSGPPSSPSSHRHRRRRDHPRLNHRCSGNAGARRSQHWPSGRPLCPSTATPKLRLGHDGGSPRGATILQRRCHNISSAPTPAPSSTAASTTAATSPSPASAPTTPDTERTLLFARRLRRIVAVDRRPGVRRGTWSPAALGFPSDH
ncbi:unnamed protein product [Urochloa humidicola]